MQIHQVIPKTKNRKGKYIGRGGKRGTYSGRGIKGQKARAGRKNEAGDKGYHKETAQKRGYRFKSFQKDSAIVNLGALNKKLADNSEITPKILVEYGLVKAWGGKIPPIKILGDGELDKKFSVSGCLVSKSAKEKNRKSQWQGLALTVKARPCH